MNGMTTEIYFELKDKEKRQRKLGIMSLCKIHSDHLLLLQIHFKVTENYQVSRRNGTHDIFNQKKEDRIKA